ALLGVGGEDVAALDEEHDEARENGGRQDNDPARGGATDAIHERHGTDIEGIRGVRTILSIQAARAGDSQAADYTGRLRWAPASSGGVPGPPPGSMGRGHT